MPTTLDQVAPTAPLLGVRPKKKPLHLALAITEISAHSVLNVPNEDLLAMHRHVHQQFGEHFRGNHLLEKTGLQRVQLLAAHAAIALEMKERGFDHKQPIRMMKSGKPVLEANSPRGDRLFSRNIRMLVHSAEKGYPTDKPIVVLQDGKAIGEIRLAHPFVFPAESLASMKHLHGLSEQPTSKALGSKTLYGFSVIVHKKYAQPKTIGDRKATLKSE